MMRRLGTVAALLLLVCASPPGATAEDEITLEALLSATDDGGQPILDERSRGYFAGLPDHAKELIANAVDEQWITSPVHLREILSLRLNVSQLELAMSDNCVLCHTDPESQSAETLFSNAPEEAGSPAHMNLANTLNDVHFRRGLSCAGCHGGDPHEVMDHDFPEMWPANARNRHERRDWIPPFCARCHSDTAFMRRFNPALPTDQLEKYRHSQHGQLLLGKSDSRAAQCISCHGVHGILGANSPLSLVYPKRVPETCAACHSDTERMAGFHLPDGSPLPTDQFELYRSSVHGRALLERGDVGAPACNDCHGNHAAMPPEVSNVSQICRTCHARNGTLFDGSRHKIAFERHGWPECDTCHGEHAIEKTTDEMLASGPKSLCHACHAKYASENPECDATAEYFHNEITRLARAYAFHDTQAEELASKGLDVETIRQELAELFNRLAESRSYIHAFNRSEFAAVADKGEASIQRINELGVEAKSELRSRFTGLFAAVVVIGLLIFVIALKLRQLEGDDGH